MASDDDERLKKKARTESQWAALNLNYAPYKYALGKSNRIQLPLNGYWFRTSAGHAFLTICGTSVGTREAGPVAFNGGPAHAYGCVYLQSSGRAWASIDFHHKFQEDDITGHILKEVLPGVFQNRDHHTLWICPGRFNPYAATVQEVIPRIHVDETSVSNFVPGKVVISSDHLPFCIADLEHLSHSQMWKVFAWLHSGRELAYLVVMDTGQVIWCSFNGAQYTPEAHGEASYFWINDELDLWHIHFHCYGVDSQAKSHLLVRVSSSAVSECFMWRSPGNEYKTFLSMAKACGGFRHVAEAMYDSCSTARVCMIEMAVKPGLVQALRSV